MKVEIAIEREKERGTKVKWEIISHTFSEENNKAWTTVIYSQAQDLVKEKILVYYILREAKAIPGDADFNKLLDEIKQSYVDQYLDQYIDEWFKNQANKDGVEVSTMSTEEWNAHKKTMQDKYSAEEWEKFKKDRSNDLVEYYGEENFKEKVYYSLLSDKMIEWVENKEITIKTLDERHNFKKAETK